MIIYRFDERMIVEHNVTAIPPIFRPYGTMNEGNMLFYRYYVPNGTTEKSET